jgi:hypothetical protein
VEKVLQPANYHQCPVQSSWRPVQKKWRPTWIYRLTDRHLLANLVPTFADRRVSHDRHGRTPTVVNLSFLDRSRYSSLKQHFIYPHKCWVDPIPDPLLLRKFGSAGNRFRNLWVCSQEDWQLDHRGGPQNT